MSGQDGARGYFVQALIALLESLNSDAAWESVSVEPDLEHEQVDIMWRGDGWSRVVQVKTSKNSITKRLADTWARNLQESILAEEYCLILVGPCSSGVRSMEVSGKVRIPPPRPLDIYAALDGAAHRIGLYLEHNGIAAVRASVLSQLAFAMTARLMAYSTGGTLVSREQFNRQLLSWVHDDEASTRDSIVRERIPGQTLVLSELQRQTAELANLYRIAFWSMGREHENATEWRAVDAAVAQSQYMLENDLYIPRDVRIACNRIQNTLGKAHLAMSEAHYHGASLSEAEALLSDAMGDQLAAFNALIRQTLNISV